MLRAAKAASRASEKLAYTGERATLARRRISRLLRWYLLYGTRAFPVLASGARVNRRTRHDRQAPDARSCCAGTCSAPPVRYCESEWDGRCLYLQVISDQGMLCCYMLCTIYETQP